MPAYTLDAGAAPLSIRISRGDEFYAQMTVRHREVDAPFSLEGFELRAPITLLERFEEIGALDVTVTDPAAGLVTLSMQEAATAELEVGSYVWRLKWISPDGVLRTILRGVLEVVDEVQVA